MVVDSEILENSENPVQNKVITSIIQGGETAFNNNLMAIDFDDNLVAYTDGVTSLEAGKVVLIYE